MEDYADRLKRLLGHHIPWIRDQMVADYGTSEVSWFDSALNGATEPTPSQYVLLSVYSGVDAVVLAGQLIVEYEDWWCDHHEHLASHRSCSYTDDPANAPGNRKPIPVILKVFMRFPDHSQTT